MKRVTTGECKHLASCAYAACSRQAVASALFRRDFLPLVLIRTQARSLAVAAIDFMNYEKLSGEDRRRPVRQGCLPTARCST
jgi:hypothetical protein